MSILDDRRYFGLRGRDWIEAIATGVALLAVRYLEGKQAAAVKPRDEVDEAAGLLGIDRKANPQQVRAAFRAKMKLRENSDSHPDRGGAGDMALRLINAKNVLLAYACSTEATTS